MVLPRWACGPWSPRNPRTLVRRGLVFSAVWIVLGLAGTWLTGALADTCQRLVNRGLSASQHIQSSLALSESWIRSEDTQWAEYISETRGASEALQGRLADVSWLLPQPTSDAIAEVVSAHRDFASSLPVGGPQFVGSARQRRIFQNKVHELAGAWLRVSTSLTASK